jgi:sigma-B regulation protein RsbU (phosphoserine phosphatase)
VVTIWSNGSILAQWPHHSSDTILVSPDLQAVLGVDGVVLGEIHIVGLTGSAAQERLTTDARMLTHLIKLEDDLEDMTAELIESQDQLLALYNLAQSTRSHLDMSQTLQSLAQLTARLVNVQASFMVLDMPGALDIASYPVGLLDDDALAALFHDMQQRKEEMIWNNASTHAMLPAGIYNLCMVPIRVGGSIIAALGLLNNPYGFTAPDLQLLRAIAAQAAAKIENLLLHHETLAHTKLQTEMDLASQAQVNLLPQRPPYVGGLDIYAESRPALHVGGDFYDFIYKPGSPLFFSLGDVAGKGMSAAMLMAMTRTAIRSKASFMPRATPEMIMNRSNDDLADDFARGRKFATVFVGQYEPTQRRLLYTNAGQSPVIYCPHGGAAQLLEANGTAMGTLHMVPYGNQALFLQPGDVLFIATDGFSEARNEGREIFGFDRLTDLIGTIASAAVSAQEIATTCFNVVDGFENGFTQDDDRTLIVIKVQ